jgi:hypothetical protein
VVDDETMLRAEAAQLEHELILRGNELAAVEKRPLGAGNDQLLLGSNLNY